ncbi:Dam family site-specific DNA-(adenine-N6)-methyltransferase [Gordonia sp. PP30]|uniref:Dam family site-specific DNA-(adenine-N6)-methyltransferase n=1 Tax=Gordonia sp. PP30 TaxID=2935861 RepID=UPI001FFE8668|nr:Dam family site-specific DNA-(adenine-N6)-methyltransferase [Gordonia sp. PP30]UQE75037.1 Dam family site-specific DNA-(adenine-N6)-methyltransferase [Gordonia sp. PP30]
MKTFQLRNRRYLGSKRAVLPVLDDVLAALPTPPGTAADLFAGTGVVGESLARAGLAVTFNDLLSSNTTIYRAFFGSGTVRDELLCELVGGINDVRAPAPNYFSTTFAGTYFSDDNARLIGHFRSRIEDWTDAGRITERERAVLISSLLYGMDKQAATVGHYDAFRAGAAAEQPRLVFGLPELEEFSRPHAVTRRDANQLVREQHWDLVYIDPPYNSRQYGDLYHVLDNVTDWQQGPVRFKARKMDRRHLKSDYCTTAALPAFSDLIDALDTSTIVMSYNDTGERGNARSAARLTDDDILSVMGRRGRVEVIDVPHREFTTGRSGIGDIVERLFVCRVAARRPRAASPSRSSGVATVADRSEDAPACGSSEAPTAAARSGAAPARRSGGVERSTDISVETTSVIRSPLNYTGNKKRLVREIIPLLPAPSESHRRFVDVFGGSMTVGMNAGYPRVVLNDVQGDVIALARLFASTSYGEIVAEVERLIAEYGLTDSQRYGYQAYGANSSNGLGRVNKDAYLRLRADFNAMDPADRRRPFAFFTLVVFGFNNQIRYNGRGRFNMPVGKRDFNSRVRKNLFDTVTRMHRLAPELWTRDFREVFGEVESTDVVYCDPPYLLGTAPYNEQNAWTVDDETALLDELSRFAARGGVFGLSNVLSHKGTEHSQLADWACRHDFVVHTLEHSYANSSYHRKDRNGSREVLITNHR